MLLLLLPPAAVPAAAPAVLGPATCKTPTAAHAAHSYIQYHRDFYSAFKYGSMTKFLHMPTLNERSAYQPITNTAAHDAQQHT